jgi:hypothetical protein
LYSRVDYRDIFDEPHHTECCMSIGFQDDPSISRPDVNSEFVTYLPWGPQNTAI